MNTSFAPRGDQDAVETGTAFAPLFDASGLIVAIVSEATTGEVLMVAYMNAEALARTIETSQVWFWSRSRKEVVAEGRGERQRIGSGRPPRRLRPGRPSPQGAHRRGPAGLPPRLPLVLLPFGSARQGC
jgi:hypothetical protein